MSASSETKIHVNVYRMRSSWRYATWVEGFLFRAAALPVDDDASEAAAIEAARALYADPVTVKRTPDLEGSGIEWFPRKPAQRRGVRASALRGSAAGDAES